MSGLHVLIDGREPTIEELALLAVSNNGHFTAMQVRNGGVRGLDLHLRRLVESHRELFGTALDPERTRGIMRQAVAEHSDSYLWVTLAESDPGRPTVMTVVRPPLEPDPTPVSLLPTPWVRAVPHLKHVGTFPQGYHARRAQQAGYDDALLVDAEGVIAETTIANIAFVEDDGVVWPDAPALPGITRLLLDDALPPHGLTSRRAAVGVEDLHQFAGAVLTNSIGVVPVARIGDHQFPDSTSAADRLASIYRAIPASPM